jgi:ribosome modulation factor
MTTTTDPTETKALRELDRLTARYTAAEQAIEDSRKPLHETLIRHVRERSAPPGEIANHSPYDRNHIGLLAREAGVHRGKAGPRPDYDEETVDAALGELDELTTAYNTAVTARNKARDVLYAAIAKHYKAGIGPKKLAEHCPYDRNHILRIARKAGVPPIRGKKKTQAD